MSSQILIYTGNGTGPFVTKSLKMQIENLIDGKIHKVVETNLFSEGWNDPMSIKAYVVPGGNAVTMLLAPYATDLASKLTKYSTAYLGVCAGGILASRQLYETYTERNGRGALKVDVRPSNMLDLVENDVIAPLFPKPTTESLTPADFRILNSPPMGLPGSKPIALAHVLSPGYIPTSGFQHEEILSNYSVATSLNLATDARTPYHPLEDAPFVESLFVLRGTHQAKTLLTGAHAEINSSHVQLDQFRISYNASKEEQEKLALLLQPDDVAREALFKSYLEKLGVSCRKE